jgi:hypothetical protein
MPKLSSDSETEQGTPENGIHMVMIPIEIMIMDVSTVPSECTPQFSVKQ